MKNLIVWLNSIINKHKALKRWRRVVTVLAAIMTFVTTYALILPAITVEKNKVEDVGGMYLEQEADTNDMLEENALEPIGVSIAAEHENAVTFAYADDSMTATAVFGTNDEIPAGAELVVTPIDPESVEYTSLSSRAAELLDKEFIYDVTTCSFYDFALVLNNVDVTPKTGLVDIQIIFHDNTVEHLDDTFFAGRFARSADDSSDVKDELVSVNPDESSVIELADGIITVLSLKGNDLSETDSLVGILAGNVDEEIKAAAAETDAEIPDSEDAQEESAQADSAGTDGEEAASKVGTLKASGSDYTVTLTYDATSEIPEGASLTVSEIAQNSKEYKKYLEETKKAMGLTEEETLPQYAARFFDIKIMVGGDEFVPESGVTVEIAYTEPLAANPETEVNAVHFHNDTTEPEVIEANVTEISSDGTSNVEFTAEAFSVYGVVYTVDFEYSVNGKMYQFSLPGGGFVSFTDLVEVLGIIGDTNSDENGDENGSVIAENVEEKAEGNAANEGAEENGVNSDTNAPLTLGDVEVSEATRRFVADVASVEFSSPELVDVSKVENETTVGQIKESRGLECQYSAELTEEQIAEINAQAVEAGDWALISVQPFTSEETLTVTMKNGDQFVVKVTDASYSITQITDLNGAKGALINPVRNNAVQSTAHSTYGRLQAAGVSIDNTAGNISTTNTSTLLTEWTFSRVGNSGNNYYIQSDAGYLNIDSSGRVFVTPTSQALRVDTNNNNQIRIRSGSYALNNWGSQTGNGYGSWNGGGDRGNDDEWLVLYELGAPNVPHVTVHYVDRDGNVLTGVRYTGGNTSVIDNEDGTFTIPYSISESVDLRSQFDFSSVVSSVNGNAAVYTYANTHLAGKDASGTELTYNGLVIDSALTRSDGTLNFKSDSGETNARYSHYNAWGWPDGDLLSPQGNLGYGNLQTNPLSDEYYRRPTEDSSLIKYVETGNKDIYVILDPLPGESAAGISGVNPGDVADPTLEKTMESNEDGTYTLSLKVDAHATNASDTNKANVLFVVDTSSSMRAYTKSDNSASRITDTHDAVKKLGADLLAYNTAHPDAVEVAMLTFDGSVDLRQNWTKSASTFTSTVDDYLKYYYLHTGTDWEDGMKEALNKLRVDTDEDPTFVIFFTDGEPSQYTNFHGKGENTNTNAPDPITHDTSHESVTDGYGNFYSYFLSRESAKDEMRAIVNEGAQLYGIYAYNSTNESYSGYNGAEDGAAMLHNAIKYGYNTTQSLKDNLFYEAKNTDDLKGAFDKIFNLITESVGFSNVVVEDGISAGVTSSTIIDGDVTGFTYIIRDNKGQLAYKVTVAPNGASKLPEGVTVDDETPLFWFSEAGPPVVGQKTTVPTTKIKKDGDGNPILDEDNNFQTETVDVEVYYYKDADDKEYIMPISTTGENISWDLSPLGLLKDGYSYEVNFVVWPNQEAYDLVADLNNGKKPEIEATANWQNCPIKTDSAGRQYRQGGFPDYPYISRYEDNGVYSAMSNTEQKVDYYKFDRKIEDGQEITVITHGSKEVLPPDPMPLTASLSRIEKLWNYQRNPSLFAQYLYNTDGSSKGFVVDFDVFQGDNLTDPYTGESLGWVYDLDGEGHYIYLGENESGDYVLEEVAEGTPRRIKGHYVWAPGDTMTNVTYAGYSHRIGTRWVSDFSIATGLILTEGEMERLGLNKSRYPSTEYGEGSDRETYYILEPGHDYTIKEHQAGTIGYEFDFIAPVYHPMLIDGVLKNVEIKYTYKQIQDPENSENTITVIDTATISSITGSDAGLSGLEIENTLRGYINLNKIVVDEHNVQVESDNTKFEYVIKLDSTIDPGPFKGDHIPWYGVKGLYYNDGHGNYYQVYEAQDHTWMIRNEAGREYEVTSTGFNPDEAGEQTVTYEVDGQEKQVTLYGNQMTATEDGKHAEATLAITQSETLYIANIPVGTTYTITESNIDEYYLIDILKEVKNGTAVEKSEHVTNLTRREATGTIVTNRDNHVTYTNQVRTGALKITKTIQKNGNLDTSATGKFYYAVYDEPYNKDADPAQIPVRAGFIDVTTGGTAEATEPDLKIGTYYVYELTGEGGTPVISGEGGIFTDGKYYAVTTTGSPAAVSEGQTSTAGIVNNYVTTPVTATKSWSDNNPQELTIYFKLFYENAGGVAITTGTPLKPLASGVTSVTWSDMPKYDENGNEYNYIVREYVLDDTNGEFEENGHKYMEAAPSGYVNTEEGLSVTNSKITTYEPVTTYSGLKLWVDTVNGGKTRPDGLTVTLMIDKDDPEPDVPVLGENGEPLRPDWVTVGENQWRYTFTKLPMFDDDQKIIKYYAIETPVAGYADSITSHSDTKYVYVTNTLGHTTNDAYPSMSSDADLIFTAVRINYDEHLHHIWTQRVPTAEEKTRLVELVNSDLRSRNYQGDATVDNVRWVSGLPIDHEFLYSPTSEEGYKIAFTWDDRNPPQPNTIHIDVRNHNKFDNICYGTLQYNYTAGSTDFKNELQPKTYTVEKTWGDGITPPDGAVVTVELQGAIQRKVEPQPAEEPGQQTGEDPEPQYETVQVDIAALSVDQKLQVILNGGAEGGDDTTENPWKYSWSNLPPCDKAGNEITYSVKEISYTIGGHTVNLKDFVPSEDTSTEGKTILTNQIPAYNFDILKIDSDTAATLPGAKFTIQAVQPTSTTTTPVTVGEASPSDPETTGENGKVSFNNYSLGYYEVWEKEAPTGYIRTSDGKFYVRVDTDGVKLLEKVISDDDDQPKLSFKEVQPGEGGRIILGNVELTKSGNVFTFTVENERGAALPNTGGPGTRLFTILGSILILGAGVLLWRRRRFI